MKTFSFEKAVEHDSGPDYIKGLHTQ